MRFIAVVTTLCTISWMTVHAMPGPVTSCVCPGWSSTRVPVDRIINYTIQCEGVCPLTAVAFQTKAGFRICSDPNSDWAKRAIVKVDEEARALLEVEQITQASTTDFPSTVAATTKNARRKKGSKRRRQKRLRASRRKRCQKKILSSKRGLALKQLH